jgi:hypothetical protein
MSFCLKIRWRSTGFDLACNCYFSLKINEAAWSWKLTRQFFFKNRCRLLNCARLVFPGFFVRPGACRFQATGSFIFYGVKNMSVSKLNVVATTALDSNNADFFFEFLAYVNDEPYAVKEVGLPGNKGQTKSFEVSLRAPVELSVLRSSAAYYLFNIDQGGDPQVHWLPASLAVFGWVNDQWEPIASVEHWDPKIWFGLPTGNPSPISSYKLVP